MSSSPALSKEDAQKAIKFSRLKKDGVIKDIQRRQAEYHLSSQMTRLELEEGRDASVSLFDNDQSTSCCFDFLKPRQKMQTNKVAAAINDSTMSFEDGNRQRHNTGKSTKNNNNRLSSNKMV
jgi:hypothetical protein